MQNQELNGNQYVLFSVPMDMLEEAGISPESIIQMSAASGKIIIDTVRGVDDFVCDGDCENCPIAEVDCDGNCVNCPCFNECEEAEVNKND